MVHGNKKLGEKKSSYQIYMLLTLKFQIRALVLEIYKIKEKKRQFTSYKFGEFSFVSNTFKMLSTLLNDVFSHF